MPAASKIKRLPPSVASQIAAGEVIERPASLLKELVENSLDAGAGKISVEALGAGRKSLRVVDDGCGMSPDDCVLCLERHATSKISALSDLSELRSFGFRGEALFAAAAVSRLTLISRPAKTTAGFKVESEAGRVASSGPAASAPGTSLEVRDLFFNTPARNKFLKSDAFEKSRLMAVMEEAALANPAVSFSYKSEGRTVLRFPAEKAGDPLQAYRRRAASVLGDDTAATLVPIEAERPEARVRMLLSPWDSLNPSRNLQYWFVNGRPIVSRTLQQALYRAYKDYRSRDRHPVCVGHLDLDPAAFDVNVHPGKREVRFKSDREMHELVYGLAHSTLARTRPAADLLPGSSSMRERATSYSAGPARAVSQTSAPFLNLATRPSSALQNQDAPAWFTPPLRYLGQIEKSYLIFEAAGGIFVLDQHAAAERILFEKYLDEIGKHRGGQRLLVPIPIELPASKLQHVLSLKDSLAELGFMIEPFGETTMRFTGVPALFHKVSDLNAMIHRLLDSFAGTAAAARDTRRHAVATIACKAAVKAHDPLSPEEALRLVEDLKTCRDGTACPHGRRAMLALDRQELARRFQRPGAPPL